MKRVINVRFLKEIINDLKKQQVEMKNIESKLKNDILSINEVYKGSDATLIISKYTDQLTKVSSIIKTLESFINYYEVVVDKYDTNIEVAIKKLQN